MKIISIASKKGGVGKSTTAVTLAAHLAARGRTLLVDADEQLRSAWYWTTKKVGYTGWGFDVQLYSEFMAQRDPGEGYAFVVMDTKGGGGP